MMMKSGGYTWDGRRHPPAQRGDCGLRYLLWAVLGRTRHAGRYHVGLQQRALQEDVVVCQSLVNERQHLNNN